MVTSRRVKQDTLFRPCFVGLDPFLFNMKTFVMLQYVKVVLGWVELYLKL